MTEIVETSEARVSILFSVKIMECMWSTMGSSKVPLVVVDVALLCIQARPEALKIHIGAVHI